MSAELKSLRPGIIRRKSSPGSRSSTGVPDRFDEPFRLRSAADEGHPADRAAGRENRCAYETAGERGGRGQIGFTVIDSLEELNEQTLVEAEILQHQFVQEEWGGANEAHLLSNGHVGVLGHIACFDPLGKKHYYAMVFSLNPDTFETTPLKIIAARSDFPVGPGKRPDLQDVIFSGLVRGRTAGRCCR